MKKTIRLRGLFKGLFFKLRIDCLFPVYLLSFFSHFSALSKWIQKHKRKGFNDFYTFKFDYKKREQLFEHVIITQQLDTAIDYLEFGVSTGYSFRWWMNRIKDENARFYGFDTFTGLPESWGPFKKGDMGNGNTPPEIDDNRHKFYQGLFQQTFIPFLSTYDAKKRKIIHLDADIYSATLYVLTLITPYLNPGDILFFDEFNVPMHEYKAFAEWSKAFYIDYEVLGGVNNFYQMALMIK